MTAVSIITVNYNSSESCQSLAASMFEIEDLLPCEWIVVNNSPSDDLSFLSETVNNRVSLQVIESESNIGFGAGCNRGAAVSNGEVLLFINPDCEFTAGSPAKIIDRITNHQGVGIVGPRIVDGDGKPEFSWGEFPGILAEYRMTSMKQNVASGRLNEDFINNRHNQPKEVDWVTGGCFFIKRSLFQKMGGFDEEFFLYYEDIDLCKRVSNAGYSVLFDPSFGIMHLRGLSGRGLSKEIGSYYRQSQRLYYKKHKGIFCNLLLKLYLMLHTDKPSRNNSL
ncbi:hypothetical protein CEE37_11395 [candidate division LCP-89 bacterium B3_LCP]|uniref:Glycosyltransferase 2-like domain-containing protein n=1 Tax=candidate division LCP-89 bacterium B3_LCP TaxID=2012998 RepID=A0A532UVU9_UNCL8|nr:MAG: hypothetical protein CEE37_11395 [candidate division LCP-89 bacterium B3_LCP]